MTKTKTILADFLRRLNENDNFSPVELAIIYRDVSIFFDELYSLNKMHDSLYDSLTRFKDLKSEEETERDDLDHS